MHVYTHIHIHIHIHIYICIYIYIYIYTPRACKPIWRVNGQKKTTRWLPNNYVCVCICLFNPCFVKVHFNSYLSVVLVSFQLLLSIHVATFALLTSFLICWCLILVPCALFQLMLLHACVVVSVCSWAEQMHPNVHPNE